MKIKEKLIQWRRDMNLDYEYYSMLSILTVGVFTESKTRNHFWEDVDNALIQALCVVLVATAIHLITTRKLKEHREQRFERLKRGWLCRIINNICAFACAGCAAIFAHMAFPRGVEYTFGQYVIAFSLVGCVYVVFFTLVTAFLDYRTKRLSNS